MTKIIQSKHIPLLKPQFTGRNNSASPSDDVTTPCSLWRMLTLGSLLTWTVASVTFVGGLTSSNSISQSARIPRGLGTPSNVTINLGLAVSPRSLLVRGKIHRAKGRIVNVWQINNSWYLCIDRWIWEHLSQCVPSLDSAWYSRMDFLPCLKTLLASGCRLLQLRSTHYEGAGVKCLWITACSNLNAWRYIMQKATK